MEANVNFYNVTCVHYVYTGAQAYVVTAAQNPNPKPTIQSSLTNTSTIT